MMRDYIVQERKVNGLEISYVEYRVVMIDRDTIDWDVLAVIASFLHKACADGLCDQLCEAYTNGSEDALSQVPDEPILDDEEWAASVREAHESMGRIEQAGMKRMVERFDNPGQSGGGSS